MLITLASSDDVAVRTVVVSTDPSRLAGGSMHAPHWPSNARRRCRRVATPRQYDPGSDGGRYAGPNPTFQSTGVAGA